MGSTRIDVVLALMIIASFLAATVLRECGHTLMAYWLGDRTPLEEGRLTLRLRPHLDSVGTLLCVILAFLPPAQFGLGWGKPVKPDPWKLRIGADRGIFLVALAGILSNLIVGLLMALITKLVAPFFLHVANSPLTPYILQLLFVFAVINVGIALFNLLPVYPLDGYQMLYSALPSKQAVQFARSAPYGVFIILILFFLVPFLANLSGLSSIPILGYLFDLPQLIQLLSTLIVAPIIGQK